MVIKKQISAKIKADKLSAPKINKPKDEVLHTMLREGETLWYFDDIQEYQERTSFKTKGLV